MGNAFAGAPDFPLLSQLGPTVSNDQGPFGPYWHDGTFIPYRPAALRDPRFYHHEPNWTHPQHNAFMGHAYNTMPNVNIPHNPYQLQQPPAYRNIGRPSVDYQQFQQPQHNAALDYQSHPLAYPPQTQRSHNDYPLSSSGQTTPTADQIPLSNPLAEFGPQSLNAQSREKVFAWAHNVYVDLLKYLQSTRKSNAQNAHGHQQPLRPHIYPKPPRQPAASFSSASASASMQALDRPDVSRTSSYDSYSQAQPSRDAFQRPPHHRSYSAWPASASDLNMHRQSWHPVQQQPFNSLPGHPQMSGMEPMRPLRRMSGSIASVHPSFHPETPPSMTAASALDAITKHCEESKWNWIDGILLGGCLAYALGDYQKAQDWYKHILKLDKE